MLKLWNQQNNNFCCSSFRSSTITCTLRNFYRVLYQEVLKLQNQQNNNFCCSSFCSNTITCTASNFPQEPSGRRQIQQDDRVDHTILSGSTYFIWYWSYLGLEVKAAGILILKNTNQQRQPHLSRSSIGGEEALHVDFKLKFPSRAYDVSVNHRRQIIFSTNEHPVSWNDKTLWTFDQVMGDISSDNLLAGVKCTLYDQKTAGEIIKVQYSGAWQLVDNSYLTWFTVIPQMKRPITTDDNRFSWWPDSMRKDTPYAFGIGKHQFQVLRFPIPLQITDVVN